MVLTVHDELVFDVVESDREAAASLVEDAMEEAYPLTVPLKVDIGWGKDWSRAAPAGH
jgi:DNA polymerase-1